jgi:hypothetical protein
VLNIIFSVVYVMEVEKMKKYAILALGIAVCLAGAALMAIGKGLIGENYAGIATAIGIAGICLIAGSSKKISEKQTVDQR